MSQVTSSSSMLTPIERASGRDHELRLACNHWSIGVGEPMRSRRARNICPSLAFWLYGLGGPYTEGEFGDSGGLELQGDGV